MRPDRLGLLGHVDGAHAPLADRLQQLVGADDRARARSAGGRGTGRRSPRASAVGRLEEARRPARGPRAARSTRRAEPASPPQAASRKAARSSAESISRASMEDRSLGVRRCGHRSAPGRRASRSHNQCEIGRPGSRREQEFPGRPGRTSPASSPELAAQPGPGVGPVPLGGARRRCPRRLRGLLDGQPGEVAELDQLGP